MIDWLDAIFHRAPEIALFLAIAAGYAAGHLRVGAFRLGTATGTLLVALLLSGAGVQLGDGVRVVLTALFLYAAGFEAAPHMRRVLRADGLRAAGLALVYLLALAAVVVALPAFGLAGQLAPQLLAGVVAPITAPGALPALAALLHVATALMLCGHGVPMVMRRTLLDDAVAADVALNPGVPVLGPGEQAAAPELVGRLYRVAAGPARSVAEVEGEGDAASAPVTISRIRRGRRFVEPAPHVRLATGDVVLVVGRRAAVLARASSLGDEVHGIDGMALSMQRREVLVTRADYDGRSIGEIRAAAVPGVRHGVVVVQLSRMGRALPLEPATVVRRLDTVTLHGAEADVARVAALIGDPVLPTARADLMVLGGGLVLGLLLGVPEVTVLGVRLGLGPGGALLAGLIVGWYHARRRGAGAIPGGALRLLKDFGTAALTAVVGLGTGAPALAALHAHGAGALAAALAIVVVPLGVALLAGRWMLGFSNGAPFAGALAGTAVNAPALGDTLARTDSPVPVVPFLVASLVAGAGGQLLLLGFA